MMIKRNKKKESTENSKIRTEPTEPQQEPINTGIHWKENIKYVQRTFPGPSKVLVPLRVAIDRNAFVNMTDHVMKSIDEEVCGVMIGEVCVDEEGFFVQVRQIIKGSAAHQGGAHVTFTHDTWNQIHYQLENNFPGFDILGWYHSHPGFGVIFSEMDLFIQRNFFSSPTQFALVIDPLGGEKALCVNTSGEVQYINKFWVDGREYRAFQPDRKSPVDGESTTNTHSDESLAMIETRLTQVLQTMDKLNNNITRVLTIMGSSLLAVLVIAVFYMFFINPSATNHPPQVLQYVPVPVQIGDKKALVGVGIIDWEIPPELVAQLNQAKEESMTKNDGGQGKNKKTKKGWFRSVLDWFGSIFKKEPAKKKDFSSSRSPAPEKKADSTPVNSDSNPKREEKK